jgi:hypothetical protein
MFYYSSSNHLQVQLNNKEEKKKTCIVNHDVLILYTERKKEILSWLALHELIIYYSQRLLNNEKQGL